MREAEKKRLVRLIEEAHKKSAEAIHEHIMDTLKEKGRFNSKTDADKQSIYELEADSLLENGVIVPPCKVGDVVFFVHEMCDENGDEHLGISEGKCVGISMQEEGLWTYCRYENGLTYSHRINEASFLNKDVFPTKAEAEYALKNRRSVSLVNGPIEE